MAAITHPPAAVGAGGAVALRERQHEVADPCGILGVLDGARLGAAADAGRVGAPAGEQVAVPLQLAGQLGDPLGQLDHGGLEVGRRRVIGS
jgi:hypothetical protein